MAHLWFLAEISSPQNSEWLTLALIFRPLLVLQKQKAEALLIYHIESRETRGKKKIKKWQPKLWFHHLLHLQWRLRDKFLEQDQLNPQLGHQEKVALLLGQLLLLLLRSVCFSLQKPFFFFFPFFPLWTAASTLCVVWVLTYLKKKELKCIFL